MDSSLHGTSVFLPGAVLIVVMDILEDGLVVSEAKIDVGKPDECVVVSRSEVVVAAAMSVCGCNIVEKPPLPSATSPAGALLNVKSSSINAVPPCDNVTPFTTKVEASLIQLTPKLPLLQ